MVKNGRMQTICNIALAFMMCTMVLAAILYEYFNTQTIDLKPTIVVEMILLYTCMFFVVAMLFLLRNNIKSLLNDAFQDVTGIHNKESLEKKFQQLSEKDDTLDIGIMIFDLNNLKVINDEYGHEKGDEFIKEFASFLSRIINSNSFLGRFGGDEFVIIQEHTSAIELQQMEVKLQYLVESYNLDAAVPISYAAGYEVSYLNHYYLINELLELADKKMYDNKAVKKSISQSVVKAFPKALLTIPTASPEYLSSKIQSIVYSGCGKKYALIMSDVEKFHLINESYNYEMGNELLEILSEEFREFKTIMFSSRFHTDVFISVADVTGFTEEEYVRLIKNRNKKITSQIKLKYHINYFQINSGIRFVREADVGSENMISFANIARRKAKNMSSRICVYTELLEKEEKLQGEILHSFQNAINGEEFQVYFQPKINAKTMEICSAEALVRWEKSDGTMMQPNLFIPLLEKTGFIEKLDFYVYEKTFSWLSEYGRNYKRPIPISLNVSPAHLGNPAKFIGRFFSLVKKYGIDTDCVILEITESMYIEHPEAVNKIITKCHERNIKISMDDFGAGYSSLNTLKNILFDEVKIDKQFLSEELSANGRIVLQELFHMLRRMKKNIVCEGVETQEIADFLINEGCDEMQGFLYHRPMKAEDFQAVILKELVS